MRRPTPFPTWVTVLDALRRLPDDSPVTLAAFRKVDAEREWGFAVTSFGRDGPTGSHPGPSPWLVLVAGQCARTIRQLLPIWASYRVLPAVGAEDFSTQVLRTTELLRRLRVANAIAEILVRHPHDYMWLKDLVSELNPDPLRFSSDMDSADDLPFGDSATRTRGVRHSPAAKQSPSRPPQPEGATASETVPHPASTRPSLRRLGARRP